MNNFESEVINRLNDIVKNMSSNNGWIQNLISTISGIIIGTILTIITQQIGSLKCYIESYTKSFYKSDGMGGRITLNDIESPELVEINIIIDFYNTKQKSIGIRNIQMLIKKDKKKERFIKLDDNDTLKVSNGGFNLKSIEILNIDPNVVIRKKLSATLVGEDMEAIINKSNTYIVYTKSNMRNRKIRIVSQE